jgi:hypothetical protein
MLRSMSSLLALRGHDRMPFPVPVFATREELHQAAKGPRV